MFEQAVLAAPPSHRLFGTFAGVTCQAIFVGGLILAPMLFPQMLPDVHSMITLVAPSPPPAPPAPGPTVRPPQTVRVTHAFCRYCAPVSVPKGVPKIQVDEPPDFVDSQGVPGGVPGGIPGGTADGLVSGILNALPTMALLPPQVPAVLPVQRAPIIPAKPPQVTGGMVKMANPIHRVEPLYPPIAKQARIQGTVEIEAVIAVDGHLREIHVKSGPALLVKAATDAVKQWVYEPTTLNGVPVEVVGVILVTFRLN
jgi:protein TonB